MFMTNNELENQINVIKHKCDEIGLNFLEIGKILLDNKVRGLYKEKYSNFEVFIQDNFTFSYSRAMKFIRVAEQFKDFQNNEALKKLGIEKVYQLTFLEEDKEGTKEYIEEVADNPRPISQINREMKRFDPLITTDYKKEELERKLKKFIKEIEDSIETINMIKEKSVQMLNLAEDYPYQLNKIKELLEVLK